MSKYQNKYRIESRLPNYDYSQLGAYFITICTHNKIHYFGEIINSKMQLNVYGKIVEECWNDLPKHYSNSELDEFIIMPNHLHCIMMIVETGLRPVSTDVIYRKHDIPELVRALKSFSSRKINTLRPTSIPPIWQRNYYEHIIRNEKSLFEI